MGTVITLHCQAWLQSAILPSETKEKIDNLLFYSSTHVSVKFDDTLTTITKNRQLSPWEARTKLFYL